MAWQPHYAHCNTLQEWTGETGHEPEFVLCIESASRAIDLATNRQFGLVDAPEARYYTAEYHFGRFIVYIVDMMHLPVAVEVDCQEVDYDLLPFNASAKR